MKKLGSKMLPFIFTLTEMQKTSHVLICQENSLQLKFKINLAGFFFFFKKKNYNIIVMSSLRECENGTTILI